MAANALIQTRIDAVVKEQAAEVIESMGLTVSDAVRILLTSVAKEGALPVGLTADSVEHDAWFRAKIQEAIDDPRPTIPHDQVEAYFAKRRSTTLRGIEEGNA